MLGRTGNLLQDTPRVSQMTSCPLKSPHVPSAILPDKWAFPEKGLGPACLAGRAEGSWLPL